MRVIPRGLREAKHAAFGVLPGRIGLRNRACLHHLRKPNLDSVFQAALEKVGPGKLCIDCGANKGSVTQRMVETGADVIAFEPDPWSFQQLSGSISGNGNVTLFNKAVGGQAGVLPFYRAADFQSHPDLHSLGSSLIPQGAGTQEKIQVEVIDFPEFIQGLGGRVEILKMDIEGAEVDILERLFATGLIACFDHIFVETHELLYPELLERTWTLRGMAKRSGQRIWLDWH